MFSPSKEPVALEVVGAGSGGLPEMVYAEDAVSFGLVKVPIGSGTFARGKFVLIHMSPGENRIENRILVLAARARAPALRAEATRALRRCRRPALAESCPGLKRARTNARKGDIKKALGEVHAELSFSDPAEATFDATMEQLAKVFAGVDSGAGGDGASVSKLKEDYEEMLRQGGVLPIKPVKTVALTRKTAAELGGAFNATDVLAAVREPIGHFNWALFRPTADASFDLVNAGSLSVPELAKWLRDDEVLCGVLRLGFGVGRFRRVKWVRAAAGGAATARRAKPETHPPPGESRRRATRRRRTPAPATGLPHVVRALRRRRQARQGHVGARGDARQARHDVRRPRGCSARGPDARPGAIDVNTE